MYVCMYVCIYMYVCMYECMHVCVYVCTYVCTYVCMYVRRRTCTHRSGSLCTCRSCATYACSEATSPTSLAPSAIFGDRGVIRAASFSTASCRRCATAHTHAHAHAHAHVMTPPINSRCTQPPTPPPNRTCVYTCVSCSCVLMCVCAHVCVRADHVHREGGT
jgi:hypothetical protein